MRNTVFALCTFDNTVLVITVQYILDLQSVSIITHNFVPFRFDPVLVFILSLVPRAPSIL